MREFSPTQQIRMAFLAGRYATADEIASDHTINCKASEVRFFIDRAGLPPCSSDDSKVALRCKISRDLASVLEASANARRLGRCGMADALLETILAHNLVGAVMDDGRL